MAALEIDHSDIRIGDILTTRDGRLVAIVDQVSHMTTGTTFVSVLDYYTCRRSYRRDSWTTFFIDSANRKGPVLTGFDDSGHAIYE